MKTWWAEQAWLGGPTTAAGVVLQEKDGRFAMVTPNVATPPPGAHRLMGLTLPGMANTHSHAFHRVLRGRTHEQLGSFWSWRQMMYEVADRLDPDSYFRLARAVFAEMVQSGFTAVGEFHYIHHGPGGTPYADPNQMGLVLIDAAAEAGIRLTLLDTCYLRGGLAGEPLDGPQLRFGDGDAFGWVARVSELKATEGVVIGAAVHSARAVPPDSAAAVAAWAEATAAPLHAHVSEQRKEHDECLAVNGESPLALLAESGALGDHFTAVHGTHLDPDDIGLLAETAAGCCVCPTTERDLGDGIGPFAAMQHAGIRLSIGTDSHAVIDPFEEVRAIETGARLALEERGIIPPVTLLQAATSGGMRSLGWDAGRLEVGRLADFTTVRLDSVRTAGSDRTSLAPAVFAATGADVTTVVVGGREVVIDGRHRDIPDVTAALSDSIASVLL